MNKNNEEKVKPEKIISYLHNLVEKLKISELKVLAEVPTQVMITSANDGNILDEFLSEMLAKEKTDIEKFGLDAIEVTDISKN